MQFEQSELEAGAGLRPKGPPKMEIFHFEAQMAAPFWG